MSQRGTVTDFVSQEGIKQLEDVKGELKDILATIGSINSAGKGLVIDLRGIKDLSKYAELQDKMKQQTEAMADVTLRLQQAEEKRDAARKRAFDAELKRQYDEQQRAEKAIADRIAAEQKAEERRDAIRKKREDANARAERQEVAALDARMRREEKLAEIAERSRSKIEAATERERAKAEQLNNAYDQLRIQYNKTSKEAQILGVQFGVNDVRFKETATSAKRMYEQLLQVEEAVGKSQRKVGQYNQAAFALSQILREGPAFAYSYAQGLLAISNNIPMLVDQIQLLNVRNAELRAQGQPTVSVFKQLASAIFSWEGAITIAVSAITILAARMDIFNEKANQVEESVKRLNDQMAQMGQEAAFNTIKTANALSDYLSILNDTTAQESTRMAAFEKLQEMYPQYLKNITFEGFLKGEAAKQVKVLADELEIRGYLSVAEEKYNLLLKERLKIGIQIEETKDKEEDIKLRQRSADIGAQILETEKELVGLRRSLLTFPKQQKGDNEGLLPSSPSLTGEKELAKAIAEREKQRLQIIIEAQKAISANQEKTQNERLVASSVYHAAEIQQEKAALTESLAIEEAYIKESLRKTAELQQKKADLLSGKGSMSEEQRKAAIHNVDLEIGDEVKLRQAARERARAAIDKYNADTTKIIEDAAKERLDITKQELAEWVKLQEDAFAQQQLDQLTAYMIDEARLKASFDEKIITRKQYDKQLKELQHKQRITELEAQVEYDKRILANTELSAQEQLAARRKLLADEKALADEQARITTPAARRRTGRITDPLAALLGGAEYEKADLDLRERYQQAFYDNTIELAKNAADAIMAIENAKFDNALQRINEQQQATQLLYSQQERAINATAENEIDRRNQLAKLAAQQAGQESIYEQQKRQVALQQARFQRTASIASATANGAVAVTKALAELGPLAALVIPLIVGTTAAQIAAISAAPIPQYATGTLNHKGGKFIAGDGGQIEYIQPPHKQGYWSKPTSTLYDEPAGTKVFTLAQLGKMGDIRAKYAPGEVNTVTNIANANIMYTHLADLIGEKFDDTGRKLAQVVHASRYRPQKQESMRDAVRELRNMQGY